MSTFKSLQKSPGCGLGASGAREPGTGALSRSPSDPSLSPRKTQGVARWSQGGAREEPRGASKSQQEPAAAAASLFFFYQNHPGFIQGFVENSKAWGEDLGQKSRASCRLFWRPGGCNCRYSVGHLFLSNSTAPILLDHLFLSKSRAPILLDHLFLSN